MRKLKKFEDYGKALHKIAIKAFHSTSTAMSNTSLIKHKQDFTIESLSSEPIKIVDISLAKKCVIQWINQKHQVDQVELYESHLYL